MLMSKTQLFPTENNLEGIAVAIIRLQELYRLDPKDMIGELYYLFSLLSLFFTKWNILTTLQYYLYIQHCYINILQTGIIKIFIAIFRVRKSVFPGPRRLFPCCSDCSPESAVPVCHSLDSGDHEEAPKGRRSFGDETGSSKSSYLCSVSSIKTAICYWSNTAIT